MAVTLVIPGKLPINLMGGETAGETRKVDWLSDSFKAALFTASHTPAQDTDELYASLTNEVANGNGYTTGGNALANPSVAYSAGSNLSTFDMDNPALWTASGAGFAFRYVWAYDVTTDLLLGYLDYGSTVTLSGANGDTFALTIDVLGLITASVP